MSTKQEYVIYLLHYLLNFMQVWNIKGSELSYSKKLNYFKFILFLIKL